MILSYSFPQFEQLILSGEKKHTFRGDPKYRWKAGMSIQHWMGNPRNTRAKNKPREFLKGECKSVQTVMMFYAPEKHVIFMLIDDVEFEVYQNNPIIKNDGLTWGEFIKFFFTDRETPYWEGRLIHFTDLKY